MATYSVTVVVDPTWIPQFRSGKMNLCTAFSVTSTFSKVLHNVIATHEDPTPLNTITWSDQYSITACKGPARYGAFVNPSTLPVSIKHGESVKLQKDWKLEVPDPDTNAPNNGYLFMNATSASALLFKWIRNKLKPIYVTTVEGNAPPGQHTLTPTGRVMVFFADAEARTAFKTEQINSNTHEYSYLDHSHVTVYFNSEGIWETIDENSSDAVAINVNSLLAEHRNKVTLPSGGVGTVTPKL